jgi:hypothetical protein
MQTVSRSKSDTLVSVNAGRSSTKTRASVVGFVLMMPPTRAGKDHPQKVTLFEPFQLDFSHRAA